MIEHQDCRETYKCQFCEKVFMFIHLQLMLNVFKNHFKEYVSKTALISHKRIHQAETLKCNECGKQFNGSYEFSVHLRFHKREKEVDGIKCHICFKEFTSSRYLPHHMTVHMERKEKYSCNYCNKVVKISKWINSKYFFITQIYCFSNIVQKLHWTITSACMEGWRYSVICAKNTLHAILNLKFTWDFINVNTPLNVHYAIKLLR